jgi:DNA polymerase III epsilon subunit-like protein
MLIRESELIVFDTETTGLDIEKDRVVEFAAALVSGSGEITRRRLLINPGVHIPEEVEKVHGISNEMVADKPGFPDAWARIQPYFSERVAVGFNAIRYDSLIVAAELKRHGIDFELPRVLDVAIFVQWHLRHMRGKSLVNMCDLHGISPERGRAHSAAVDSEMTAKLLIAMIGKGTIPDTVEVAFAEQERLRPVIQNEYDRWGNWAFRDRKTGRLKLGAGKSCGIPIGDTPKGLCNWILNLPNITEEARALIERVRDGKFSDLQKELPI